MSAAIKSLVVAIIGLLFAVLLGSQLGQGSWAVPVVITGGCMLFACYLLFFRAVRIEALVLGFLIFGYIVGNRGFAQLNVGGNSPLYLGEVGLAACLALIGSRLALSRENPIPKSPLSWAILAFLILGGIRLYLDAVLRMSNADRMLAIRDSAAVYYALFFLIAYKLGANNAARRVLERSLLIACVVMLPVVFVYFFVNPMILYRVRIHGYPLIAHKGDLTATYLAFASIYFFLRPARGLMRTILRVLSLVFFAGMLTLMARAAFFGFAAAAVLLLIARRPQYLFYQAAVGFAALMFMVVLQFAQIRGQSGFIARLTDRVESMTDISGTGTYRGGAGEYSSNNNQFRLVWWRLVINETLDKSPWIGLGFGYDLAADFVRAYYGNLYTANFDTRSPHSIWVTIFGRMGAIGVVVFGIVVFFILRDAIFAARRVARGQAPTASLSHWCAVLILLGSASFGVVLEGPMGGILFWTFLGLASSQLQQERQSVIDALKPATVSPPTHQPQLVRV
jgi:hypothetical protein